MKLELQVNTYAKCIVFAGVKVSHAITAIEQIVVIETVHVTSVDINHLANMETGA